MCLQVPLKEITFDGKHAVVGLGMLVSDAPDMGVAKIMCMFGCSCEEQTKSFLNAYKRALSFVAALAIVFNNLQCADSQSLHHLSVPEACSSMTSRCYIFHGHTLLPGTPCCL